MTTATITPDQFTPIGSRVLVRVDDNETKTPGGLFLPDVAARTATTGTVIAVGPGKWKEDGRRETMQLNPGDRVLFRRYNGIELGSSWPDLLLFDQDAVSGVVVGEGEDNDEEGHGITST